MQSENLLCDELSLEVRQQKLSKRNKNSFRKKLSLLIDLYSVKFDKEILKRGGGGVTYNLTSNMNG